MKMLKNGKESCGSKSRHIHIRYFFTKNVINRENMELKHYYRLRNIIMGHDTIPAEECVGISNERATGTGTKKNVHKKVKNMSISNKYKVSNNFD